MDVDVDLLLLPLFPWDWPVDNLPAGTVGGGVSFSVLGNALFKFPKIPRDWPVTFGDAIWTLVFGGGGFCSIGTDSALDVGGRFPGDWPVLVLVRPWDCLGFAQVTSQVTITVNS